MQRKFGIAASIVIIVAVVIVPMIYMYIITNNRVKSFRDVFSTIATANLPVLHEVWKNCKDIEKVGICAILASIVSEDKESRGFLNYMHRCRQYNASHVQCLPNVMLIGASKSGTTSLVSQLSHLQNVKFVQRKIHKTGFSLPLCILFVKSLFSIIFSCSYFIHPR